MATALLLDFKGQDPQRIVQDVLDPIVAQLCGFDQLRIFIYADTGADLIERQRREVNCQSTIDLWEEQKQLGFKTHIFYDVYGVPVGPCYVWFKNIWLAFQDSKIQRIIYLPYDINYMVPKVNPDKADDRLQNFIDRGNQEDLDLLLGNYECLTEVTTAVSNSFLIEANRAGCGKRKDIPKNFLEDFTILELATNFPQCFEWFSQKRDDPQYKPHPRTGFFALSRRLYEEFVQNRRTMIPYDGTFQLLICAAMSTRGGQKEFRVAEQFVAQLEEPTTSFIKYGVAHQRQRIAFGVADERQYWSRKLPSISL